MTSTLKELWESTLRIEIFDAFGLSDYTQSADLLTVGSSCPLIHVIYRRQERKRCYVVWLGFPGPQLVFEGLRKIQKDQAGVIT